MCNGLPPVKHVIILSYILLFYHLYEFKQFSYLNIYIFFNIQICLSAHSIVIPTKFNIRRRVHNLYMDKCIAETELDLDTITMSFTSLQGT